MRCKDRRRAKTMSPRCQNAVRPSPTRGAGRGRPSASATPRIRGPLPDRKGPQKRKGRSCSGGSSVLVARCEIHDGRQTGAHANPDELVPVEVRESRERRLAPVVERHPEQADERQGQKRVPGARGTTFACEHSGQSTVGRRGGDRPKRMY